MKIKIIFIIFILINQFNFFAFDFNSYKESSLDFLEKEINDSNFNKRDIVHNVKKLKLKVNFKNYPTPISKESIKIRNIYKKFFEFNINSLKRIGKNILKDFSELELKPDKKLIFMYLSTLYTYDYFIEQVVFELYMEKKDINIKKEDFSLKRFKDLNKIREEIKDFFKPFKDIYLKQVAINISQYLLKKK